MKKILFAVGGIGLGNASRILAIAQELDEETQIRVASSGKSYLLLNGTYPVHRMRSFCYSEGKSLSILKTIAVNYNFIFRIFHNIFKYLKIIDEFQPDVIVTDSDFCCFLPAKFKKIPLIAINHSFFIKDMWSKLHKKPKNCLYSYYFCEKLDQLLISFFAEKIVCPAPNGYRGNYKKVFWVNPIVRQKDIKDHIDSNLIMNDSLLIMLGGSGLGSDMYLSDIAKKVIAIGQINDKVDEVVDYRGVVKDSINYLKNAKYIVVQGGYSSLCELFALKKPAIIVPVKNHAEQYINANLFQELGLGLIADNDNLSDKFNEFLANYSNYEENFNKIDTSYNGASQAAKIIMDYSNGKKSINLY